MMRPAAAASHLEILARWISDLDYSDVPAETLRAARYQVMDMVAAARAGARSAEAASIGRATDALSVGDGRSTVAGRSQRSGPMDAALANAAYSMTQDFDDIVWMGHTCHSAVFASLAVAEHEKLDGRAFLTAVVVANEVAGRLGASTWLGPLNGQMLSFIHLIGAAAATAKLLQLDAERTLHAMAIALLQPGFVLQPGFMRPTSKLLVAASPTATGIHAAYLAREGMTGDPYILEDRRGLWSRFAFVPQPYMLSDLGQFWVMQTLTVKTYPGCHYFQTACEAIDAILARRGKLELERVTSVDIATTKLGLGATSFAAEYAAAHQTICPVNVNFDLRWTAAVMLQAGRLTSSEMQPDWLAEQSPALRRWHSRVHVHHDPVLTARVISSARSVPAGQRALRSLRLRELPGLLRRYRTEYQSPPLRARDLARMLLALADKTNQALHQGAAPNGGQRTPLYFPNRVVIGFRDGSSETQQVDLPAGSFFAPSAEAALETKFLQEMAPSVGAGPARAAFAAGLCLGELALSDFVALSCLGADRAAVSAIPS